VPTALASVIASVLSIYAAVSTAQEKERAYNKEFESLVNDKGIIGTFGGEYAQSVREEQATATLIALQSVADSETQRRSVLLIGARLLNADPSYLATGSDAARLLTLLIDEAELGRGSWNPFERMLNDRLWQTVSSDSFMDLVTAGYENNYYNDDYSHLDLRPYLPTLNGDAPISHDAKFEVLWKLTAPQYDGWVNVATFRYNIPHSQLSAPAKINFISDISDVALKHDVADFGPMGAQYVIPDPRATQVRDLLFTAKELVDPSRFPQTWIMLKHRLLRDRPPVEYINPDGSFKKGSLGRIIGVVPAGSCVTIVEALAPVLVFVPAYAIAGQAAPKAGSRAPVELGGLVHMWAHVKASKEDASCLETVAPRKSWFDSISSAMTRMSGSK
jgi:hypothetical protein